MKRTDINTEEMKELYEAILKLKNQDDCRRFFRDLCTVAELKAMAERFQVAQMIADDRSYREISAETGTSTTTVARVAHWFHHGMGGYRLALDRLKR